MAVKIYSDKTNKFYKTLEEANQAEFELKEKENREKILAQRKAEEERARKEQEAAARKEAAAKVDEARKNMLAAQKAYREALDAFVKQHGPYHFTSTNVEDFPTLFSDFFGIL